MRSRQNITSVEARVSNLETKFEAFMQEMRDFKTEMRDRDNQRAAEIRELRQKQDADMKEINQRFYAKFDAMDAKIDNIGNNVRSLTITAMVGVGASVIAVVVLVGTTLFAVMSR